jgi:quinol monooxygenase YgiN
MFLRLVQATSRPENTKELRDVYDEHIIPTLQQTPGCLFACLLQGVEHPADVGSLTLWETKDDADEYTRAGTFASLMEKVRPFLAETSELKMHLSSDLRLEVSSEPDEPTIGEYPVSLDLPTKQKEQFKNPSMYLRIVSVALKPDMKDIYHRLYINEIIPALQETDGCLHAYLVMPSRGRHDSLSITIWESKHHADAYERSGQFQSLVGKVKHTFTDLIQWKLQLNPHKQNDAAIGEEIQVQGYGVLSLKEFGSSR